MALLSQTLKSLYRVTDLPMAKAAQKGLAQYPPVRVTHH